MSEVANDVDKILPSMQETENTHDTKPINESEKRKSLHSDNITQEDNVALLQDEEVVDAREINETHLNDDGTHNKALSLDIEKDNSDLHKSTDKIAPMQIQSNKLNAMTTINKEPTNASLTVQARPYKDRDVSIIYVASFDSSFSTILSALPVSPTKAWVYNFDKAKLVDLEKAEVIKEYDATSVGCAFYHMKVIDENRIFFQDTADNTIKEMKVKNSTLSVVNCYSKNEIFSFTILRNGSIVACVMKEEGFFCFKKYAPFIQLYSTYGNLLRESKLEYNGSHLVQDAYDIVENNNGDLWIAGEKMKDSEWIVVLDKNFKFRFTYEREEGFRFSATTLGVCPNNNILVVILKDQCSLIDIIDENGHFLRQLPIENFSQDGSPTSVSVDQSGKAWIVTSIERIVCIQI